MDGFLVDEQQAFGVVREVKTMTGSPCDYGFTSKSLGPNMVRDNAGYGGGPSFADQAPGAEAKAHANQGNPFAWTGHPGR